MWSVLVLQLVTWLWYVGMILLSIAAIVLIFYALLLHTIGDRNLFENTFVQITEARSERSLGWWPIRNEKSNYWGEENSVLRYPVRFLIVVVAAFVLYLGGLGLAEIIHGGILYRNQRFAWQTVWRGIYTTPFLPEGWFTAIGISQNFFADVFVVLFIYGFIVANLPPSHRSGTS